MPRTLQRNERKLLCIWFPDIGLQQATRTKVVLFGGETWGTHKSKRAGPGHATSENEMITFSTETSAHGDISRSEWCFPVAIRDKGGYYTFFHYTGDLPMWGFVGADFNTHLQSI